MLTKEGESPTARVKPTLSSGVIKLPRESSTRHLKIKISRPQSSILGLETYSGLSGEEIPDECPAKAKTHFKTVENIPLFKCTPGFKRIRKSGVKNHQDLKSEIDSRASKLSLFSKKEANIQKIAQESCCTSPNVKVQSSALGTLASVPSEGIEIKIQSNKPKPATAGKLPESLQFNGIPRFQDDLKALRQKTTHSTMIPTPKSALAENQSSEIQPVIPILKLPTEFKIHTTSEKGPKLLTNTLEITSNKLNSHINNFGQISKVFKSSNKELVERSPAFDGSRIRVQDSTDIDKKDDSRFMRLPVKPGDKYSNSIHKFNHTSSNLSELTPNIKNNDKFAPKLDNSDQKKGYKKPSQQSKPFSNLYKQAILYTDSYRSSSSFAFDPHISKADLPKEGVELSPAEKFQARVRLCAQPSGNDLKPHMKSKTPSSNISKINFLTQKKKDLSTANAIDDEPNLNLFKNNPRGHGQVFQMSNSISKKNHLSEQPSDSFNILASHIDKEESRRRLTHHLDSRQPQPHSGVSQGIDTQSDCLKWIERLPGFEEYLANLHKEASQEKEEALKSPSRFN